MEIASAFEGLGFTVQTPPQETSTRNPDPCFFQYVFCLRSAKRRRHAVTSQKVFIDYSMDIHGISIEKNVHIYNIHGISMEKYQYLGIRD